MRSIRGLTGGALLLCLATACGDTGRDSAEPVVRDSVGIRIVESGAPRWPGEGGWTVGPEPRVDIGVVEGDAEYLFSNIEGAVLLDDGRIAVADRGSSELRFYEQSGAFEKRVGGPGGGPGELGYIRGLGRCGGDSLYVWELDYMNVVFNADGEYVREARPYPNNTRERRPYELRCARNGYYAAVGWERREGPPRIGFYRAEASAWILAPARAEVPDPVETIPDAGLVVAAELGTVLSSERIGHANGSGPHPFGRATRLAMTSDAVYMGAGEGYEVRRYSLNGDLVAIYRWTGPDLAITESHLADYRAEQLADASPSQRPAVERWLSDLPLPPALPAYERIETDADGNVWVRQFERPGQDRNAWTVLDPAGTMLGSVHLPTDFDPTYIGTDVILGIARDEMGVERIRLYDLRKGDVAAQR